MFYLVISKINLMKPLFPSGKNPFSSVIWSHCFSNSTSFTAVSIVYAIIMAILIGGCSHDRGKIKLHARDSADSAIAGHWVLIDSSSKSQQRSTSLDRDILTAFILNEDHSATLYKKGPAAIKEMAGNWKWSKEISDSAGRPVKQHSKAIVITDHTTNDSIISLKITGDLQKDEPILSIPNSLSYKKEPERMH